MKNRKQIALLLCFVILSIPYGAVALSIEEMPAHRLIDGSTHVVLAKVLESQKLDPEPDPDFPSVVHTIQVVHNYKGKLPLEENLSVIQNMGSLRTGASERYFVIFINSSRRDPDQLVVFNTMQGLMEVDEDGYFTGFGPVDIRTLEELEEMLQTGGHDTEREASNEKEVTLDQPREFQQVTEKTGIRMMIDGTELEAPEGEPGPFINTDNRTLIPVRLVSEKLGATVEWDQSTRSVNITSEDKIIKLVVGEREASVNGERVAFDTSAVVIQGRTFVPLRFVSEALGVGVRWEEDSQTVVITLKPY